MIAHTLLCYSLYSRECWEHEWPLRSAGTDLVRCGDLGALLGLRREYSAAFGRASRANYQCAARTQRHSALLPTARACTRWYMEPKPSYRTRRGIRIRARARGGGVRGRPSWAPCDGAGGRWRGRRAFAAAATALAAPPLSSPWTARPSPPKQLSSPTLNACPDGKN